MEPLAHVLLTYLLHSSLLLGVTGLLCLLLRERQLALQEAALRAALLGGFLTAGLSTGLGLQPLLGTIDLATPAPAPAAVAADSTTASPLEGEASAVAPAAAVPTSAAAIGRGAPTVTPAAASPWPWTHVLASAWGALALLGLARLASAALRLRRLLHDRSALSDDALAASVRAAGEALGLASGPRLSLAPRLAVPIATGLWRPEVCLPPRALAELGQDEQLALCAHELAHVARRDPAWLLLARLAEALAPLQPLNRWARGRLQDLAECLSDDLAVAATDRAQGLARSLVDVASWSLPERRLEPAAAVGALSVRSRLGHRVERLMDPLRTLDLPRRFVFPAALAFALAVAFVAPAFSSDTPQPEATPAPAEDDLLPEDELPPPEAPLPPEAPAARPAPAPRPAPAARPAPPAPPAPAARPAPPAPPAPVAERELEQLAERIARRAKAHEGQMAGLEAEIEALVSSLRPHEAEIERLAQELAAQGDGDRAEVLRKELEEKVRLLRLPEAEMRSLQEKARALAEAARPSEEELRELRSLSERMAHETAPQAREMARVARDQARAARDEMRVEMRQAAEEMRRAGQEMRRAVEEMRRAIREATREATRAPRSEQ